MKKRETLAVLLRNKILSLPAQTRLPSVRALMRQYDLSISTVNSALRQLENEGLINARQGSGIYINARKNTRHIAFCRTTFPSLNAQIKELGVMEACTRRGWTMATYQFHPEHTDLMFDSEIRADGVVVMPEIANFGYAIFKTLLTSAMPLAVLGCDTQLLKIDSATGDDTAGLSLILKKLISLNHSRIAFLSTEPHCYEVDQKILAFKNLTSLLDLHDCPVIDCLTQSGQASGQTAYQTLHALLKQHAKHLPFTAIITCSSPGCYSAIRALHEQGWSTPADCSVICMQDDPLADYYIPSVASLKWNYLQFGEECVALIEKRLATKESEAARCVKIVPELNVRESLAEAPTKSTISNLKFRKSRNKSVRNNHSAESS